MIYQFTKRIGNTAIMSYFMALFIVCVLFFKYTSPLLWQCWGIIEIVLFFVLSSKLSYSWRRMSPNVFTKRLFCGAFIISLLYVIISYYLYLSLRGEPFEYDPSDASGYHDAAIWFLDCLKFHNTNRWYFWLNSSPFDDRGYVLYLSYLYSIIGDNILLTRIIKCLYRAFMCVFIYRLGSRHFGETVGRIAGIFCMLLPNFSFYAASHRKEMEMVFLSVWFIERADYIFFVKKLNLKKLIFPFVLALGLFSFRAVLGVSAAFAFMVAVLFGESSCLTKKMRLVLIIVSVVIFLAFSGGAIAFQVKKLYRTRVIISQRQNMEWRSNTNSLAGKATAVMFAPMIFVIPFPSMINVSEQYNQQRLNGAYYIKNILAFFAMFSVYLSYRKKTFRKHIIIYCFILSYLVILALSNFAQSERFHLPTLPILMLMSAHGISLMDKKTFRLFSKYAYVMAIVCVAWNAFKLMGRGLI